MELYHVVSLVVLVWSTMCLAYPETRSVHCGSSSPLTQNNGEILSHAGFYQGHHYGKNLNCTWVIQAPAGKFVRLTAQNFSVSTGPIFGRHGCYNDYVRLYDGPNLLSHSMGKFCGDSFKPITSTGRYLTVQFVTDYSLQMGGFKLIYNFTDQTVHPACPMFQFQCDSGDCISSTFRCDGDDDCSDDSDETGCPAKTCLPSQFQCLNSTKCIFNTWRCDGNDDCDNGSDEWSSTCNGYSTTRHTVMPPNLANKCGQLNYTGSSGVIHSLGYPRSYVTHAYCDYQIYAPSSAKVLIESTGTSARGRGRGIGSGKGCKVIPVTEPPSLTSISFVFNGVFSIEKSSSTCKFDIVTIYSTIHTHVHGPFCGETAPANFTIPGHHAVVHFASDGSVQKKGFQLTWAAH